MSDFAALPKRASAKQTDGGSSETLHSTVYHELKTRQVDQRALADSYRLFVANNPTAGTGIPGHAAATSTDATKPLFTLKNSNTASSDLCISMHSLLLSVTAAGTAGADVTYEIYKSLTGVNRFTSGGATNVSAATVNVYCPKTTGALSAAQVRFGAVVAPADSSAVLLASGLLRSQINVVGDKYRFIFGAGEHSGFGASIPSTSGMALIREDVPPCILSPGETLVFVLHCTSQSGAPSYEFRAVWEEDR